MFHCPLSNSTIQGHCQTVPLLNCTVPLSHYPIFPKVNNWCYQEMQDGGCLAAACINASCLALLDASIPLRSCTSHTPHLHTTCPSPAPQLHHNCTSPAPHLHFNCTSLARQLNIHGTPTAHMDTNSTAHQLVCKPSCIPTNLATNWPPGISTCVPQFPDSCRHCGRHEGRFPGGRSHHQVGATVPEYRDP